MKKIKNKVVISKKNEELFIASESLVPSVEELGFVDLKESCFDSSCSYEVHCGYFVH